MDHYQNIVEKIANEVYAEFHSASRPLPEASKFDPMTIAAIISVLIDLGRLAWDCWKEKSRILLSIDPSEETTASVRLRRFLIKRCIIRNHGREFFNDIGGMQMVLAIDEVLTRPSMQTTVEVAVEFYED